MQRVIAAQTRSLIESLHAPVSFWKSSVKHKIAVLDLIRATQDPAAIPDIACLLLNRNRSVAHAAAVTVAELFQALKPFEFPWLDRTVRERSPYRWSYPSAWADLKPDQVGRLFLFGEHSVFSLGLASFHFSGYVREAALDQLSRIEDGSELPFLLLRLSDWVDPVRRAADRIVRSRLRKEYAPSFVLNIQLVDRLRFDRRAEERSIVTAIESLLTSKEGVTAVVCALTALNSKVRLSCFQMLLKGTPSELIPLIKLGMSDREPLIRLCAASAIAKVPDHNAMESLALLARGDRFEPVRRASLQALVTRSPDLAQPWLEQALLDPHRSIRGCAQFEIGKEKSYDLRGFYLAELAKQQPRSLYAAIAGVGETGSSEDGLRIAPHVANQTPRIRRAAIRSMATLNASGFHPLLLAHLADQSPSVSREATRGLLKSLHLASGEAFWKVYASSPERHVRRNALFLVARLSKWESISYLLEAIVDDEDAVARIAELYVRRWYGNFNSSFVDPTAAQVHRLRLALANARSRLNPSLVRAMEIGLNSQ